MDHKISTRLELVYRTYARIDRKVEDCFDILKSKFSTRLWCNRVHFYDMEYLTFPIKREDSDDYRLRGFIVYSSVSEIALTVAQLGISIECMSHEEALHSIDILFREFGDRTFASVQIVNTYFTDLQAV